MADGWLQPYSRQIRDRQRLFDLKMKRINQYAGSLEGYAQGYRYYGLNRDPETGAGRAIPWCGMSAACGRSRFRRMRWPTGRR